MLQVSNQILLPEVKQRFLRSLQDLHDHWEGCKERGSQEGWSVWGRITVIKLFVIMYNHETRQSHLDAFSWVVCTVRYVCV